jgi:hypothetical protein
MLASTFRTNRCLVFVSSVISRTGKSLILWHSAWYYIKFYDQTLIRENVNSFEVSFVHVQLKTDILYSEEHCKLSECFC